MSDIKKNKIMKTKEQNCDTVSYLRIRHGVRIFGVEMDKDIHSKTAVDAFPWPRAKRRQFSRQFKMQFARFSYNHSSDETVEYMIRWTADYFVIDDNVIDTAVKLALEYDPTYKLKFARLASKLGETATPVEVFIVAIIIFATIMWGLVGFIASFVFISLVMVTHVIMTDKVR